MSSDIAVQNIDYNDRLKAKPLKPCYLIVLKDGKKDRLFFATEQEQFGQTVKCRGFFVDLSNYEDKSEDFLFKNADVVMSTLPKDLMSEYYFPLTEVKYVRNLVFRAK